MWKGWTPLQYMMLCLFYDILWCFLIDQYSGFYCSTIEIRWVAESNKLAWLDSQRSRRFLQESLQSGRKYGWMSLLFWLDTIIMSDGQFWFLLPTWNTVLAAKHLLDFDGPWFSDVIFVGAIAVALRAQLLMELTCAYSSQSLPGNCRQTRKIYKLGLWGVGNSRFKKSPQMGASRAWQGVLTIGVKIAGWGSWLEASHGFPLTAVVVERPDGCNVNLTCTYTDIIIFIEFMTYDTSLLQVLEPSLNLIDPWPLGSW